MIKKRLTALLLSFVLLISGATVSTAAEETQNNLAVTNGCHSIDAAMSFLGQDKLIDNAQSVFVFETGSQTLMYAWNADMPMYPASLVKIMTSLLVLEKGSLTDVVTVSQTALDAVSADAVSVDLQAGESLSVEDLLYCTIVYSANDAAAVLAEYVAGSQSAFVDLMNNRAVELGCTGTTYTNAHGLHNELQVTTARDTCRILQAALEHEFFRTAFGCVHYTVPATNMHEERRLSTNNYLMNTDEVAIHYDGRVTGGRAGTTADGYRCIASTSTSGNMELICVVMGSKSVYWEDTYSVSSYGGFPETSKLLDLAFSGYSRQQIIFENQILRQQTVLNGDCDVFAASYQSFSTVLPADISFDQLSFRYSDAPGSSQAPIRKGQNLAALQVWYGSMCVAQTDVYAMNDVPVAYVKTAQTSEEGASGLGWWWVLIVVVSLAVIGFAAVMVLRIASTVKAKNRKRRHMKKRRRH